MMLTVRIWGFEDRDWNACGENAVKKEEGSKVAVSVSTKKYNTSLSLAPYMILKKYYRVLLKLNNLQFLIPSIKMRRNPQILYL